jgi:inosose dehydratase
MGKIIIANAPVSWGIFEAAFGEMKQKPYHEVLDEISRAGYEGTELGPYGYLPAEPEILARELEKRNMKLGSSFVPISLEEEEKIQDSVNEAIKVGRLLVSQCVKEIIIADDGNEMREKHAGFIAPDRSQSWTDREWKIVEKSLKILAETLKSELGMKIVIHHHAGTFIETPWEIEKLLSITNEVNLLLDTGHYVYGGGDPVDCLEKFGKRIKYIHFKDILMDKLENIRKERMDMRTAWKTGVFCELGKGCVDFKRIVEILKKTDYSGWIVVEQDVIPQENGSIYPDPYESAKRSREYLQKLGLRT